MKKKIVQLIESIIKRKVLFKRLLILISIVGFFAIIILNDIRCNTKMFSCESDSKIKEYAKPKFKQ